MVLYRSLTRERPQVLIKGTERAETVGNHELWWKPSTSEPVSLNKTIKRNWANPLILGRRPVSFKVFLLYFHQGLGGAHTHLHAHSKKMLSHTGASRLPAIPTNKTTRNHLVPFFALSDFFSKNTHVIFGLKRTIQRWSFWKIQRWIFSIHATVACN